MEPLEQPDAVLSQEQHGQDAQDAVCSKTFFGKQRKKKKKRKRPKKDLLLKFDADTAVADSRPWTEKYRPSSLEQVLSHGDIVASIQSLLAKDELPHMLFYGPPGTGKTSTILACAAKMYGETRAKSMVLEINASDDTSIDTVRNQVRQFAQTRKLFSSGVKLIVLDEAEQMTAEAQGALKRIIEQYSRSTRFCLITNYINRLLPAIQSRCMKFRFSYLDAAAVSAKIDEVVQKENLTLTEEGRRSLIKLSGGDMRKVLNTLQSCAMQTKHLDAPLLYSVLTYPDPETMKEILNMLLTADYASAYNFVRRSIKDLGISLDDVVSELGDLVHDYFDKRALTYVLKKLALVQEALSIASDPDLQLAGLVSAFYLAKTL